MVRRIGACVNNSRVGRPSQAALKFGNTGNMWPLTACSWTPKRANRTCAAHRCAQWSGIFADRAWNGSWQCP